MLCFLAVAEDAFSGPMQSTQPETPKGTARIDSCRAAGSRAGRSRGPMAVLPGCVHLCITLMKGLKVLDLKAVLVEQKQPGSGARPSPEVQVTYQFEVRRCILEKQDQTRRVQ